MSSPVYFPPLFVADTLTSAAADLSGHDKAMVTRRAPPLPHGEGRQLDPRFHVKPRESPVSPLPTEPTSRSNQRRIGS